MTITWAQGDAHGAQMDDAGSAWHGGRLEDVLPATSGDVIAAAPNGGVWSITAAGVAQCLADLRDPLHFRPT